MATQDDVRAICSKLDGALEGAGRFSFDVEVKGRRRGIVWSWAERVDPKKARVINDSVLAVLTPSNEAKELLIASNPDLFFTEPHYNGYPAVLVRLEKISAEELEGLILEAYQARLTKSKPGRH